MMIDKFIFGVYGVIMFFIITFYNIRILENFEAHPKIALSNFFTRENTPTVFKILSISASILSIGYTFNMIGTLFGVFGVGYVTVFVNFMISLVLVYFYRQVFLITCKISDLERKEFKENPL